MTIQAPKSPIGLDGVPAAETALSHVDGLKGELIIAGERVADLAGQTGYEGLLARLWTLAGGGPVSDEDVRAGLGEARRAAHARLSTLLASSDGLPVVDAFRAGLAAVGPEPGLSPQEMIVGAASVIAAALVRRAHSQAPVRPDASLSHAADTLRMMRAEPASDAENAALDAYLVTVSDHGMNASTFAARVVASTQASMFAAITAGYCALTGPLHGGAPEPVLEMLDAIGTRDRIAPFIDAALLRGERLMGFGHRIYRVRDPRADVLAREVQRLATGRTDLTFAAEVEAYAREALRRKNPDRALDTNVEFFTAILLDALRIPRAAFTPIFAVARTAGWTAHVIEQRSRGRLLRPSSVYVGAVPG